jgi:hypothetical protein
VRFSNSKRFDQYFVLAAIGIIVVGLLGCGSQSPGDVVREFQTLIVEGRYDAASKHVSANSKDMFALGAAMAQGLSSVIGSTGVSRVEITSENIQGNQAEVSFIVHYRDGTSDWEEWEFLIKERGKWKIGM